jgi:glycosyltransferase involved in cell wall biosynthesis
MVRHQRNGGLAAARNTAFALAKAPWCFVLDADNALEPEALNASMAVARHGGADVAVVHGLLPVLDEERGVVAGLLGGGSLWQPEALRSGNRIDAMALIRREAWQQVGGYTHIPGGWEDFDFWCCLIDAGYRGVMCPRVLATYVRHSGSMLHRSTDRQRRPISRLLQARHPWLQLPFARPEA